MDGRVQEGKGGGWECLGKEVSWGRQSAGSPSIFVNKIRD